MRQFLESGIVGFTVLLIYFYRLIKLSIINFRLSFAFRSANVRAFYFGFVYLAFSTFLVVNLSSCILFNYFTFSFPALFIVLRKLALDKRKENRILEAEEEQRQLETTMAAES